MNRREAVKNFTFLLGGALTVTSFGVLSPGCGLMGRKDSEGLLTEWQAVIEEIADTIIPATGTPGAKAAGVGPFIVMMMTECYSEDTQNIFIEGLDRVERISDSKFGKSFLYLSQKDREIILGEIRSEAETLQEKNLTDGIKDVPHNFFELVRELTLLGYFTSEIGATQALDYVQIPGSYESCTPLQKNQKAILVTFS